MTALARTHLKNALAELEQIDCSRLARRCCDAHANLLPTIEAAKRQIREGLEKLVDDEPTPSEGPILL